MALIAVAPTISRLRAQAHASASNHSEVAGTDGETPCEHEHGGSSPDGSKKCGYCDFLTHAPTLVVLDVVPAFPGPAGRSLPLAGTTRDAAPAWVLAAQPRGPPLA